MNKVKINLFDFLRSCVQFLKILIVFSIMLFIFYWIQNLTGITWKWFKPLLAFFDLFTDIGERISSGSIMLFNAVFEFKHFIALLIFIMLYAITHFVFICINTLEELYGGGVRFVKKVEEKNFNKKLEIQNIQEQKKIKRYQIYIEASVKPKFAHREYNINMEEQNHILIKHLIEKLGQCPEKYENGYLFTFESFTQIDDNLDVFLKLFESKAPINYIVCVQIIGINARQESSQLKTLIGLKNINKITTLADTAYRYNFNDICRYETSQLGVFQKENGTFEVHQFIVKN